MPKIVVTERLGEAAAALLDKTGYEIVSWTEPRPAPREWLLRNVKGANGLCVMMSDKINDEVLDAAGDQLQVVSTFSVGFDHIDVPAVRKRNIRIGHTPNVLNDAVADITVMLVLMSMRRANEAMAIVREGQWSKTPWSPYLLTGPALSSPSLTIGFLGFGRISQSSLGRLLAFTRSPRDDHPPRCIYTSSRARDNQEQIDGEFSDRFGIKVKRVEVDELAKESDVLIVLCSLNESTKGLVNADFLKKMKTKSVLVNTARGGIVDSNALAHALDQGTIFGAGLDVVDGEPNIQADHVLLKQPRCIVLPHIGSASDDARKAMADLCARNAIAGVRQSEMPSELK